MTNQAARTVIVSGGTGALGRSVVDAFIAAGDRVVVPWIVEAEAKAMPQHEHIVLIEADVSEPEGAAAALSATDGVDVLVNGVGGFGGGSPVHETDVALWDSLYRMNVRTAVCMSAAVAGSMISEGAGVIVNVASQAALDCPAGIAAYSASKAAIVPLEASIDPFDSHTLRRTRWASTRY